MKNPHVIPDQYSPTEGHKKFKRKVRGSVNKRETEERDRPDSPTLPDPTGRLLGEVYGNLCGRTLPDFALAPPRAQHLLPPGFITGAPDQIRIANGIVSTVTGTVTETKHSTDQPSPPDTVYQSERVLCKDVVYKRSERCLSAGSCTDTLDSPRKRLGEPSGAVTEIKAIQQTRRLLANARERTRVHTISAAFEALRKQVPCYSYGQKLSKLAILRIACNYILSLAQLADLDYTPDHSNMSFRECVEQCTRTLQAEGRSKKRKE